MDISQTEIETERLRLRAWRETDLRDFYSYASIPGVGEMAGWKHHTSLEESRAALRLMISGKNIFAIVDKESGRAIGSLGFHHSWADDDPQYIDFLLTEIGYSLSNAYWGQGLMVEAVKAVIDYCFNARALEAVTCAHFIANNRSKRVIEKCGFTYVKSGKYYARQLHAIYDDSKYIMFNPKKFRVDELIKVKEN